MKTLERSILVKAPPEKVFGFIQDPTYLPEFWPSMIDVTHVETLPEGGYRYHWLYKMAGMRFEGDSRTIAFEPNKHIVQENTGDFASTFDWKLVPENGYTKIFVKAEYEIPQTLLTKLTEPFVLKLNEREADFVVANLKDRVEA